jgi:hypothetical protein
VALLSPLGPEEREAFLVVALREGVLRRLVGRLGTAPRGTRIDAMTVWELAGTLVDYYDEDVEVAEAVDATLRKELGESPLAAALAAPEAAAVVTSLVLESRDPLRDLAWGLLRAGTPEAGAQAVTVARAILAECDAPPPAEAEAPPPPPPPPGDAQRLAEEMARDVERAQRRGERALRRVGSLKQQVADLEERLRIARQEARAAEQAREATVVERDRLARERDELRARLQAGTAAEVARLTAALEEAGRRQRALEADLEEARAAAAANEARWRALEQAGAVRPAPAAAEEAPREPGANWRVPIFSAEFYESIRRWDRRVLRNAFEKAYRLAEDWRHPSLRAIPLEGLPNYYRIRVASDVRLIYRLRDGGQIELLSLIDREDLQRYIRNVKGA